MSEIVVRYFAAAAEATGRDDETVSASTVGELRDLLLARHPRLEAVLAKGSFLVDGVVTRDPGRAIRERVDVLPPFSGG